MKKEKEVNKSGFTLIEILVVVLIIGLLTAIAVPGYRKAVEKSKASEALSNLSALSKSEHSFYLAKNKYTQDFSDLDIQLQGTMDDEDEVLKTEYFDYELLSTGVLASRNNKEYSIYRDYETSQIMCTPSSHFVCDDLGAFTKEPCEKVGMAWANTNSTCYKDEKTRCKGLYDDDTWNGEFCGYTNTKGQEIGEGMECHGNNYQGCGNSIINSGGTCSGSNYQACYASTINAGGTCKGPCPQVTINNGGICEGGCGSSIINNGGICLGVGQDACSGATVNTGGLCWAKEGYSGLHRCNYSTLNGGKCQADTSFSCNSVTVNDGGRIVCKGLWETCNSTKYNGTGCCEGVCKANAPKCNCPIDEETGMHKTSC